MKTLAAEVCSEPILQLSIQTSVSSRHTSSASEASPSDPEVVQPALATPQRCPVVPDRNCSTNSACTSGMPFGHVRCLQASVNNECAISLKGIVSLSSHPSCQCSLCSSGQELGRKHRFRVRSECLRRPR